MTTEEQRAYQKARRAELKAHREETQKRLAAERAAHAAEQQRIIDEVKAKEAAQLEELLKPKRLRIINRALIDVLVWHSSRRGRNWVASVKLEPTLPGGMDRKFFERAAGRTGAKVVIPDSVDVNTILEFGADYVSYGGRREKTRFYAVVLAITETELVVKPYQELTEAELHVTQPRVRIAT